MTDFSHEVAVPLTHKAGITGVILSEHLICKEVGGVMKGSIGL